MKLKEYLRILKKIEKEYGGDLDLVYDTGIGHEKVKYFPTAGIIDILSGTFWYREYEKDGIDTVCIN